MADDDVHLFPNECYKYLFAIITNKCSFLSISLVCNPFFFLVLPFLQPVNHSQSHNHSVVFHSQSNKQQQHKYDDYENENDVEDDADDEDGHHLPYKNKWCIKIQINFHSFQKE